MDNTAQPQPSSAVPPVVNPMSPPQNKNSNAWLKYFGAELLIVVIIIAAVAIYFFKPFNFLFPPKGAPKNMTRSMGADGKMHDLKPPASAPTMLTIKITDTGFEPSSASASGNVFITFISNSIDPVVIQSTGNNTFPEKTIPPIGSSQVVISQKGDYKFNIKGKPAMSGEIVVK